MLCSDQQLAEVYAFITEYYTNKVQHYGATPAGVDWSCAPTQELRFVKLLNVLDERHRAGAEAFSLDDIGCGYGALRSFLAGNHPQMKVDYLGVDLVPAMIRRARRRLPGTRWLIGRSSDRVADYAVASGIFNVRLDQPQDAWLHFIRQTLHQMRNATRLGFGVNFMFAAPADPQRAAGLYVTSPEPWVRFCRDALAARPTVLSGYGMPEFTLIVRFG